MPSWFAPSLVGRNPLDDFSIALGDILTGQLLAEWRPSLLEWFHVLNGVGEAKVGLPLAALVDVDPVFLAGHRAGIAILENGVPQFWGPIFDHDISVTGRRVTLTAIEVHGLLNFRRVRANLSYQNREQTAIAGGLISYAQSAPGGNLGITLDGITPTGTLRVREWLAADRPVIGQLLANLTGIIDGFDWRFVPYWSEGRIWTRFTTYYPRAGRASGVLLEHGSNATLTGLKISSKNVRQRWDGFGGDRDTPLRSTATDWSSIGTVPLMEDAFSDNDVKEQATLDAKTQSRLVGSRVPATQPTFALNPSEVQATVGLLEVGDTLRARADLAPYVLDEDFRVMKLTRTVTTTGLGFAVDLEQAALYAA